MVYNGKPYQKWMIWAENLPIFGNTHIIWAVQSLLKPTVLVTASITVADYFLMSQKKNMELFQRITFCWTQIQQPSNTPFDDSGVLYLQI